MIISTEHDVGSPKVTLVWDGDYYLQSRGPRTTYTYDARNCLTLDAATMFTPHVFAYAYADNRTLSWETGVAEGFAYDLAGRLTTSTDGLT